VVLEPTSTYITACIINNRTSLLWFGSKEERAELKPLSNEPPEDDKS